MKKLLIVFCFLLPVLSNAQFGLKIEAGPVFGDFSSSLKKLSGNTCKTYLSYQVQGLVNFKLSDKLQLESGLGYIQRGQSSKVEFEELRWGSQFDPDFSGQFNPALPGEEFSFNTLKIHSYLQQLEIPVRLNIFFKAVDKGIFVSAGIRPSLILNTKTKAIKIKDGKRSTDGAQNDPFGPKKKFNFFGRVSLGYALPIEKAKLNVSTYFDHQLLNNGENGMKFFQYSFGALVGWRF